MPHKKSLSDTNSNPFKLQFPFQKNWNPKTVTLVNGALEKILALDQLNHVYHTAQNQFSQESFHDGILHTLNVSYDVPVQDFQRIPPQGRLLVVANHPFGGIEGLLLPAILGKVRTDIKIMANFLLERIPEMRQQGVFVDPFKNSASTYRNLTPLKECLKHLKENHLLATFPSGEVSHFNLKKGRVEDPPWSPSIARLAIQTKSPILPVYFEGKNSFFFQLAGLCHPRLRTALLPHEFIKKKGNIVHARIGKMISSEEIYHLKTEDQLTDFIRERTYFLSKGSRSQSKIFQIPIEIRRSKPLPLPLPSPSKELLQEILRLPAKNTLIETEQFQVFYARAKRIPHLINEIGRLREKTFRAVGEGTGKSIDLDHFDSYYHHLWVWNRQKHEVVGAYRLGQTDRITPFLGKKGLYTSTLFKYKKTLLEELNPALEMGRSFIREEYQKQYQPLLLLWKGIATYVSRKPRYRYLFGPVSISNSYHPHSQDLMMQFLEKHNTEPKLSKMVRGRNEISRVRKFLSRWNQKNYHSLEEINERIADLETELKGIPVLLKQYLRLGGKILAFSQDASFNHVVDALILVDITQTDPKIFQRYMGKKELEEYLLYHQKA